MPSLDVYKTTVAGNGKSEIIDRQEIDQHGRTVLRLHVILPIQSARTRPHLEGYDPHEWPSALRGAGCLPVL